MNRFRELYMFSKDKWAFYRDIKGQWRWRRTASNGRIVASSSQGYSNKQYCLENARRCGYES